MRTGPAATRCVPVRPVADNGVIAGNPAGPKARDLNELIRYTMWSVLQVSSGLDERDSAAAEVSELLDGVAGKGVVTRGCYDVQGLRADADYMFWWVASSPDDLQETYARFRRPGSSSARRA